MLYIYIYIHIYLFSIAMNPRRRMRTGFKSEADHFTTKPARKKDILL